MSFLVIGGGSLQAELEREAQALGLGDRMVFTGPRRDVPRLLAACDVSVLSSVKEGMSNTIMESMAAGKPMVATRVGGNAELIADGRDRLPRAAARSGRARRRHRSASSRTRRSRRRWAFRRASASPQRFSVEAMVKSTRAPLRRARRGACESDRAARGRRAGRRPTGRIALVASQFPRNVDAYFLREIAGLAARGFRFRIFSLRAFDGKVVHAAARPLLTDTVYVPFLFSWPLLPGECALRRPHDPAATSGRWRA